MDQIATRILLGPTNELHSGVHASLVSHPVAGYEYVRAAATHYFLLPKGVQLFEPLSPHRYFHLGELLHFDEDAAIVHTSRFPVIGRSAWVMDLDNFGYPFVMGRAMWNPAQREALIDSHGLHEEARRRVENMLYACSHSSCRAVLFMTKTALRSAEAQISAYRFERFRNEFLAKSRVVYPAQAPMPKERVMAKWEALVAGRVPMTVMFCGRDFNGKNGGLALDVFDRLLQRHPRVHIVYVGRIPDDQQQLRAETLSKIEFHSDLPRVDVLDRLAASHVLIHPSRSESLGMIYLEAFAAGLAVIGAHGDGLSHISEILDPEGARIVDYLEGSKPRWVKAYLSFLESLIEAPLIAKGMGCYNYDLVASDSGKFSLTLRDKELRNAYAACAGETTGLQLEELPYWKESVLFSMESEEIQYDFAQYANEIGFSDLSLRFVFVW